MVLWERRCYSGVDPSLWLPPCRIVMPCNTTAFEGYVHSNVLVSMNAVG
jgi:hypothetical protein